jgi:UDP-GlcNAc:undecaprenyl-phosphate GlcNAc-1-phosphate transferase
MLFLIASGVCSVVFALIFTPLCRNLLLRLNLVDVADNVRKLHVRPVPRMGGIAVFAAYVGALAVALPLAYWIPSQVPESIATVVQLLPAAAIVFLTGLLDDLIGLKPWQKLAGQCVAASLACCMGVRIATIDGHIAQQWWGVPLTIVWLLGCTNAFNLIDGVDGLATGAGLFAATSIFLTALLQGNLGLAAATIPMAGALAGFLRYNFNPASIFLGDCGSLVIGFLLGCYAVVWCQKSATLLGMTAPLMALALPLLDTALAIARRFIRQQPIFGADRGHIHHRLLDRGHAPREVALRLYGVCGVAAVFSLLQGVFPGHGGLFLILFALAMALGIRHLNYVEFAVVKRVLRGTLRQLFREEIRLQQFEEELSRVSTTEGSWAVLQNSCADLGIDAVEWKCGDRVFRHCSAGSSSNSWSTLIAFPDHGYLSLDRKEGPDSCLLTARLVEILRNHLPVIADRSYTGKPAVATRHALMRYSEPIRQAEPIRYSEPGKPVRSAG